MKGRVGEGLATAEAAPERSKFKQVNRFLLLIHSSVIGAVLLFFFFFFSDAEQTWHAKAK